MSIPVFTHPAFRGLFGVARRDITPPVGIYARSWGAAKHDAAASIHRPITLTAAIFQENKTSLPLALIAMDHGGFSMGNAGTILEKSVQSAGIAAGRFLIAFSHTHAGASINPGNADKPGGEHIAPYLQGIEKKLRDAVKEALGNLQPAILETAYGKCGLATNRDLFHPEEKRLLVGWNPGKPADDTLLVGRVSAEDGRCLATLVNYACHPTILAWENTSISPDFIGTMREVVERETDAPCLFIQGASGELAARHQYVGDTKTPDRAGYSLGHAAVGVLNGMLEPCRELHFEGALESGAPLAVWRSNPRRNAPTSLTARSTTIDLALKAELPREEEILRQMSECTDRVLTERLTRRLGLRRALGDGDTYSSSHHIWALGDILFISVPNEAYSELQTTLRAVAGKRPLFVVTLANGSLGYLSPKHSYQANSYASWQSPFAEGCFEKTLQILAAEIQKFA